MISNRVISALIFDILNSSAVTVPFFVPWSLSHMYIHLSVAIFLPSFLILVFEFAYVDYIFYVFLK